MELQDITLKGTLIEVLSLFDNPHTMSIRHYERAPGGSFNLTIRFPEDDALNQRIQKAQTVTELAFIDMDMGVVNFLREKGYRHLPLPKHGNDPEASCWQAYQEFNFHGHRVCANQFSDFFGYKIFQSRIELPVLDNIFYGTD